MLWLYVPGALLLAVSCASLARTVRMASSKSTCPSSNLRGFRTRLPGLASSSVASVPAELARLLAARRLAAADLPVHGSAGRGWHVSSDETGYGGDAMVRVEAYTWYGHTRVILTYWHQAYWELSYCATLPYIIVHVKLQEYASQFEYEDLSIQLINLGNLVM